MLFDVKKGLYNAPFLGSLFLEMRTTLERETKLGKKLFCRSRGVLISRISLLFSKLLSNALHEVGVVFWCLFWFLVWEFLGGFVAFFSFFFWFLFF